MKTLLIILAAALGAAAALGSLPIVGYLLLNGFSLVPTLLGVSVYMALTVSASSAVIEYLEANY